MLDRRLRDVKERALGPVAARLASTVPAAALTAFGFALTLAAGTFAWVGQPAPAVACWLAGRLADGLDGAVARARGRSSDLGGYADLLVDTIGYTVVPLGIAAGADDLGTWTIVAVLLATFYVNSVSLLLLSALLEKRHRGATWTGESTSVTMPAALVEGTETIVFFTVALAVPSVAPIVFVVMAIGVFVGVAQRAAAARTLLAAS